MASDVEGDFKTPVKSNAKHTDTDLKGDGLGHQDGDYSVERVEQVYR